MSLIIVTLVCATLLGAMCAVLSNYGAYKYEFRHALAEIVGLICGIAAVLGLVVTAILSFGWLASEHQADIINREYGTTYTREEVFFASDVIDTVRELQRQRIEVNGDLVRGEDK